MQSRRQFIRIGVAGLVVGTAGCLGGPVKTTELNLSISEPFESEPPVSVPVRATIRVQHVDNKDVALNGVTVDFYDTEKKPLARTSLGDFSWRGADSANRETDDGGLLDPNTVYRAEWEKAVTLDAEAVPEWVVFSVEEVQFGGETSEASMAIGTARGAQPPRDFAGQYSRYTGSRPPAEEIRPDQYTEEHYVRENVDTGVDAMDVLAERPESRRDSDNESNASSP